MKYYPLPYLNQRYVTQQDYFFLFETSLYDRDNFSSYIFLSPLEVIKVTRYSELEEAFAKIERLAKDYYLAGYFSYELGYFFERRKFVFKDLSPYPLIHLAVFERAVCFNHKNARTNILTPHLFSKINRQDDFWVRNLRFNFNAAQYSERIARIKEYIRRGDTYQINFTGKYRFRFCGPELSFYQSLKNRQHVPYNAFCKFKDEYILSFSPELFFARDGDSISSRPMKGTIDRGRDILEDKAQTFRLKNSSKDRAENIMIVDLVRNDFGRICRTNSVRAAALFNIEKYNTLFQMTSQVDATLKKGTTYFDIFRNIFPGGSVTGAPKIRSMQIIRELEKGPRNIYCGALGIIFPGKRAIFNMPIRTVSLVEGRGEMGVGSGIVYDSQASREFKECILKAKFLRERQPEFSLLETILWDTRYTFLAAHLKRMEDSAQYFGFAFDRAKIKVALNSLKRKLRRKRYYKVRLLLARDGGLKLEYCRISPACGRKYIAVSAYKIDPQNVFCYHKTTNRRLYDREYRGYRRRGYFDVIFLNTRGELAEGAISNIVIEKNKKYYTPPISCGILPGIFRRYLIGKRGVIEKKLSLNDLLKADRIFLCNSVRGLIEVKLKR